MPRFPEIEIRQQIMVAKKGKKQWYFSTIQDIQGEELDIEVPHYKGNDMVVSPGEEVDVKFFTKGASYIFSARFLRVVESRILLYRLGFQRRQFVRYPVVLEVLYVLSPKDNLLPEYRKAQSIELSGGGMRLLVKEEVAKGTRLHVKFFLPLKEGMQEINTSGKVVWRRAVDQVHDQLAIEFEDIDRKQQDYIVNFIFGLMIRRGV